jgi:hypothetical protein
MVKPLELCTALTVSTLSGLSDVDVMTWPSLFTCQGNQRVKSLVVVGMRGGDDDGEEDDSDVDVMT